MALGFTRILKNPFEKTLKGASRKASHRKMPNGSGLAPANLTRWVKSNSYDPIREFASIAVASCKLPPQDDRANQG